MVVTMMKKCFVAENVLYQCYCTLCIHYSFHRNKEAFLSEQPMYLSELLQKLHIPCSVCSLEEMYSLV